MEQFYKPNFVLLDAARMLDSMALAKEMNPDFICLYEGNERTTLSLTAPYLFPYKSGDEFSNWLRNFGWGNSWGIFIETPVGQQQLLEHFRKFIKARLEDGQEIYFRFYDPRVLRVFLPTCDSFQLTQFFGSVNSFIIEDEDPSKVMTYSLERGATGFFHLKVSSAMAEIEAVK